MSPFFILSLEFVGLVQMDPPAFVFVSLDLHSMASVGILLTTEKVNRFPKLRRQMPHNFTDHVSHLPAIVQSFKKS